MRDWFVRSVAIATIGVALFFCWRAFFPSPEHLILKKLSALAVTASITPNETALVKLAKIQRLGSFFANDVQVTVDVPSRSMQSFTSREELQQAAMGARSVLNELRVHFVDTFVTLSSDRNSALAHLTATADLPGEKIPEVQELEIGLTNINNDWLINRVQTVKTLR
jgi:hypothetical protein